MGGKQQQGCYGVYWVTSTQLETLKKDLVAAKGVLLTAVLTNSMIGFTNWICLRFLGWAGNLLGSDQMVLLGVDWIGAWFPRMAE